MREQVGRGIGNMCRFIFIFEVEREKSKRRVLNMKNRALGIETMPQQHSDIVRRGIGSDIRIRTHVVLGSEIL